MIANIISKLSPKFSVITIPFSNKLESIDTFHINGQSTNISSSFQEAFDLHQEENVSNLILISDGVYNSGTSPNLTANHSNCKIHTILIGDTSPVSDISIQNVDFSPQMLLGEENFINVSLSLENCPKSTTKVSISSIDVSTKRVVDTKMLNISNGKTSEIVGFTLKPSAQGILHYRVEVECLNFEKNCTNNVKEIYIQILDGKKNIVCFSQGAHPDISAIKSSLGANKSFNFTSTFSAESIPDNTDLVILNQVPTFSMNLDNLLNRLKKNNTSILFILGSQSDLNTINSYQNSINLKVQSSSTQGYLPIFNKNFQNILFDNTTKLSSLMWPPLENSMIELKVLKEIQPLLFQKINSVETTKPLLFFANSDNQMWGMLIANNLWKWRLEDFKLHSNFEAFDDLMSKTINYLAIKKDKKHLVLQQSKQLFQSNESVLVKASLYNQSFQPITTSKVKLELAGAEGTIKYDMNPNGQNYDYNFGHLKSGEYSIRAISDLQGKLVEDHTKFSVLESNIEMSYFKANFEELNTLCSQNQGILVFPNQIDSLLKKINSSNPQNKMVEHTELLFANDIFYFLLAILSLLGLEWVLRKYFGSY